MEDYAIHNRYGIQPNKEQKKKIAQVLFDKTQMTEEQYKVFCGLAEDLGLVVGDMKTEFSK